MMTYIGEDTIALLANATLETEGQIVTADHDATSKTLLKWFHVWLDAWEVKPLDIRGQKRFSEVEVSDRRSAKWGRKEKGKVKRTWENNLNLKCEKYIIMSHNQES